MARSKLETAPYLDHYNFPDGVTRTFNYRSLESFPMPGEGRFIEWMPNEPMTLSLKLTGQTRGRSSALFTWTAFDGTVYPMFLTDMFELVSTKHIETGWVTGVFHVVKRGQNYGLALYTE